MINLKQDYGVLKQDIESLSEGGNLLTGGSHCHQCDDPGFKSLEQELNKFFQELSDLRAERDSVIERYAQEKETQVKRLQGIFGLSSSLIVKAKELSDRNREFEEEVICEQGKGICRRISGCVSDMKQKYDVNFTLPATWREDLEWVGHNLARPTSLEGGVDQQPEASGVISQGVSHITRGPQSVSTPFPRAGGPQVPVSGVNSAIERVIAENTVDSRYVGRRSKARTPGRVREAFHQLPTEMVTMTLGYDSDGSGSSSDSEGEKPGVSVNPRSKTGIRTAHVQSCGNIDVPKLTFAGEYWRGFIGQFETYAKNMPWTEAHKIDAFAMCLRNEASEFFSILPASTKNDFTEIKNKFERHFEQTDVPSTIRWELLSIQQWEDESLERYLTRLQKMIIRAYPDAFQQELNSSMFIEGFLGL